MTRRSVHDNCTKKNEVVNQKCTHAFLYKCAHVNVCLQKRLDSNCCRLNICVLPSDSDTETPPLPWGILRWHNAKDPSANARDTGSTLGLGRCPRVENGNPLQYSCLENSTDRGTWWATVNGVAKRSQT